jgi:septal ring-binding cell division protein DamX
MEDQNKLFVFEKKEVILIFLFIILIAVISFTLGVRIGKQLSLKSDSFTPQDVKSIDLKSIEEEQVEKLVNNDSSKNSFEDSVSKAEIGVGSVDSDMEARLKEEMAKLANEKIVIEKNNSNNEKSSTGANELEGLDNLAEPSSGQNEFSGKYTIQLFSHQSQETAQEFADGFISKGYDVIINEVIIPGKGKWYRVSIGIFDDVNKAKDYLENEKNLFQSKNYIIQQI